MKTKTVEQSIKEKSTSQLNYELRQISAMKLSRGSGLLRIKGLILTELLRRENATPRS